MHAHKFAHLVGKYVRMERPADEVELREMYSVGHLDDTVGGAGIVAYVADTPPKVGGWGVDIVFDYGMGFTVVQDDLPEWKIAVWESEEAMIESRA